MSERRKIFYLTVTMIVVVVASTGTALTVSYFQAIRTASDGLRATLQAESQFIGSLYGSSYRKLVEKSEAEHRDLPDDYVGTILTELVRVLSTASSSSQEGVQVSVALQKDDSLLISSHGITAPGSSAGAQIPFASQLMIDALAGKRGIFDGPGHSGERIVAVSDFLTFGEYRVGLVAYLVLRRVLLDVLNTAAISLFLALLMSVGAVFIFRRLGNPVLDKLREKTTALTSEISTRTVAQEELSKTVHFLSESQRVGRVGSYAFDFISGAWASSETLDELFGITESFDRSFEGWLTLVHPDERDELDAYFESIVSAGNPSFDRSYRIIRKSDGAVRWLHGLGEITFVDGNPIRMVGTIQDVTETVESIHALQRWEQLFSHAAWGIIIADAETNLILSVNPAVLRMYGYTLEEMTGMSVTDLYESDTREIAGNIAANTNLEGQRYQFETVHVRKDGTSFPVEIELSTHTGIDYKTSRIRAANIKDISERKRLEDEREKLERSMMESQRLESLGVLAGGIAHDFNNVLMTVLGNAELALSSLPRSSIARDHIDAVENAARTASGLTRQLLAYAGKGKYVVSNISLNRVVEEMTSLLAVSVKKNIVLRKDLCDVSPMILGDEAQLQQVIMNLVTNASESIGDGSGYISISTGVLDCDSAYFDSGFEGQAFSPVAGLEEGLYATLEVADTGCGMTEKTRASLFDPFFSTKFKGRGLGLASVLGIIRGHHGAIRVYSEIGKGSVFKVLLPMSEDSDIVDSNSAVESGRPRDWTGSGLVLLADDDESVLTVGKRMLEHLGFDVVTAADGRAAVDLFKERASEFSCAVIDLTMPHLSGTEVLKEITAIRPDVKVLMVSGYNEQSVVQDLVGRGLAGFLQKPFELDELRDRMRAIVDVD
jgi:PAS domain S-box-containing protein